MRSFVFFKKIINRTCSFLANSLKYLERLDLMEILNLKIDIKLIMDMCTISKDAFRKAFVSI